MTPENGPTGSVPIGDSEAKIAARKPSTLAHVCLDPETGTWRLHSLGLHLAETANRAAAMARAFGSEDWARIAGRLHDLGKYGPDFQSYLKSKSGYDPTAHLEGTGDKVDHSTAGGLWATAHLGPPRRTPAKACRPGFTAQPGIACRNTSMLGLHSIFFKGISKMRM